MAAAHDPRLDKLIIAIRNHKKEKVIELLTSGVDVNQLDSDGDLPLLDAIRHSTDEIVELLLSHEANPNMTNSDGSYPLISAVFMGNLPIVQKLQVRGAEFHVADPDGQTPIHAAIMARDSPSIEMIDYLLGVIDPVSKKTMINTKDEEGFTPLYSAAIHVSDYGMVVKLIEHGADINKESLKEIMKGLKRKIKNGGLKEDEIKEIENIGLYLINILHPGPTAPIEKPRNNRSATARRVRANVFGKLLGTVPTNLTNLTKRNRIRNTLKTKVPPSHSRSGSKTRKNRNS